MEDKMWNSVKDKLPPKHGTYIVFSDGMIDIGRYCESGKFYYGDSLDVDIHVTHWMELPNHPVYG
jgi:hypothetical protein